VIATMKGITTACLPNQQAGASPCLDGTFKDDNADRQAFIDGNANTYVGSRSRCRPLARRIPPLGISSPPRQTAVTSGSAFPNQTYYAQRKVMQSAITPLITP
jgi:hypothetical protein